MTYDIERKEGQRERETEREGKRLEAQTEKKRGRE